jgi:hypothetical protein
MYGGSCPASKGDYVAKGFFSTLLQTIPVIGPAVDGVVPGPPTQQSKLDDLHSNLTAQVSAWQKEITQFTIKNAEELNDLVTTILGDPDNGQLGYADIVAEYYVEPVKEQTTVNTINIVFLSIMISMIIWYILLNKKSS